ncbi:tetratricopeptide repeat protein [Sphingomonas qilianensis]|uniref:Tetratricopeptide repeat protein n=1 Tax=Sphingomonas qilianensis TaxID=1736690 RepID=A0ABU9XR89_9SPHN
MRKVVIAALVGTAALSGPVAAQSGVEVRVERLEGQMRAVQRKVFPAAGGKLIEPEITGTAPVSEIGAPSTSAVIDLTARVAALESQLRTMTGQVEQNQFKLRQLEDGFAAYKRSTDARLTAVEGAGPATGSGAETEADGDTDTSAPAPTRATPRPATSGAGGAGGARPATPPAIASSAGKDPARAQRVAAIEKPSTGDAGEDAYTYGYRLWEAKLYPEAETQFRGLVKSYPQHRLVSRAQNLLGRSLLDEGKPNLAVLAFYDNYRANPKGDRAHESLYYLAQALANLKKPSGEICKVYDELTDVYPDKLSDAMRAGVAKGRATQKCGN